jgi:membrane-associated protease RseP (regulator of RpoE activity)
MEIFDPGSFHYSGSGTSFPLSFVAGLPVIRAKFSTVTRKDIEADFVLDTALDASVLIGERFAETHRLFSSHEKTMSALDPELNLTARVAFERARDFRIGSFKTEGTIIEFGPLGGFPGDARLAGEIGGGMLRRFNVVFDYPHRRIILEPNANFHSDDQEDKSGISIIAEGPGLKTFKIVQVQPGTPAADAGIQQRDIIAGIDDDAAADLTLADVRDLFRQVGHIYKVLIDRDGKTIQITVQMRRLLGS